MKRFNFLIIFVFGIIFANIFSLIVNASQPPVNAYLFYSETCPHCNAEERFLDDYLLSNSTKVNLYFFELNNSRENQELLLEVGSFLNVQVAGVPFLVVGDEPIVGYQDDETTGKEISARIDYCFQTRCADKTSLIIFNQQGLVRADPDLDRGALTSNVDSQMEDKVELLASYPVSYVDEVEKQIEAETEKKDSVNIPLIGEIIIQDYSLTLITIIIGLLDGFNPCAMWVLLYLIGLLIGMKEKEKRWLIGATFILTSGFVYFLFLSAWLNIFLLLGYKKWLNVLIGLAAFASGAWQVKYLLGKHDGCEVIKDNKREKLFKKIKGTINEKRVVLALAGVIVIAASVNFVEILCSAGLPAIYTKALSEAGLPTFRYYLYLLLYILMYMFDDGIVFLASMVTYDYVEKVVGANSIAVKLIKLLGALLMFAIGAWMIMR